MEMNDLLGYVFKYQLTGADHEDPTFLKIKKQNNKHETLAWYCTEQLVRTFCR